MIRAERVPTVSRLNLTDAADLEAGVVTSAVIVGGSLLCLSQHGNYVALTRAQLWALIDWSAHLEPQAVAS